MKKEDIAEEPYESRKIVEVKKQESYYDMTLDDRFGFMVDKKHGVIPKVGDIIHFYGPGPFRPVRGIAINDQVAFYRTEKEQEKQNEINRNDYDNKLKQEFQEKKAEMDKDYDNLPEIFKRRIDKFRKNNPDFRWKYEAYEMFVCKEAMLIVNSLKTVEEIEKWSKLDYDEQKKFVKISEDHSGNTFGMAVRLAYLYIGKPEGVAEMHGALAPLVGSEEYGCIPKSTGRLRRTK